MTRTKRETLTFGRTFTLEGVDRSFPAGDYELVTDEELIEGLSFPVYRRIASWILTPEKNYSSPAEMIPVNPVELAAAHTREMASTN